MDRILERHDDVGTCGVYLYVDLQTQVGGGYEDLYAVFTDKNLTNQCTAEQLIEAYTKGCVICYVNEEFAEKSLTCRPERCSICEGIPLIRIYFEPFESQIGSNGGIKFNGDMTISGTIAALPNADLVSDFE